MAGRMRGRLVMVASGGLGVRWSVLLWLGWVAMEGVYLLVGEAFLCGGVWEHFWGVVYLSPWLACLLVLERRVCEYVAVLAKKLDCCKSFGM